MKHLPVGTIREIEHNGHLIYDVSLFHNQVHEVFEDRGDAIELMQHHTDAFLRLGETDAICVKYYNKKNQMHYIMMDTVHGDRNKPQVHEQTQYEYHQSHSLYFPKWSARRIINERHVNFSDVLRATVNFRPWYAVIHIVLSLLAAIFGILYIVEAVNYLNSTPDQGQMNDKYVDLWMALALFATSLLGAGFVVITMYLNKRKLASVGYDYSEVNWHRWYRIRKWTTITFLMISILCLAALSIFSFDHLRNGITLVPESSKFKDNLQLLIAVYALYIFFAFLCVSMILGLIFIFVYREKTLRKYFNEEQRKQFRKWMRNPKNKEVIVKAGRDFFIMDPKASEYLVSRELTASRDIRLKYAPEEYREYKVKSIHHFHEAMKVYIRKLREAQIDNLSKDNK